MNHDKFIEICKKHGLGNEAVYQNGGLIPVRMNQIHALLEEMESSAQPAGSTPWISVKDKMPAPAKAVWWLFPSGTTSCGLEPVAIYGCALEITTSPASHWRCGDEPPPDWR